MQRGDQRRTGRRGGRHLAVLDRLQRSVAANSPDTYCQYPNGTRERPAGFPNGINAYHTLAQIARTSPSQIDLQQVLLRRDALSGRRELPCQTGDTLNQVFQSIGTSLTAPRLYPDDTN